MMTIVSRPTCFSATSVVSLHLEDWILVGKRLALPVIEGINLNKELICDPMGSICCLRRLGFVGPFPGAKHKYMSYWHWNLSIPKDREYDVGKLKIMIAEVENLTGRKISAGEWNNL